MLDLLMLYSFTLDCPRCSELKSGYAKIQPNFSVTLLKNQKFHRIRSRASYTGSESHFYHELMNQIESKEQLQKNAFDHFLCRTKVNAPCLSM